MQEHVYGKAGRNSCTAAVLNVDHRLQKSVGFVLYPGGSHRRVCGSDIRTAGTVSSARLFSTRLLRSAIPSGLLMPQMVRTACESLWKGLLCIWVWRNICIKFVSIYRAIFYRMYWNLCFCQSVQCLNRRRDLVMFDRTMVGWTRIEQLQGDWRAIGPHAGTTPRGWSCFSAVFQVKWRFDNDSKQRQLHRYLLYMSMYCLHDYITYYNMCIYTQTIYLDAQTHTNTRACMYMYIQVPAE